MKKRVFFLHPRPHPSRERAADFILHEAPDGFVVSVEEPNRSLEQNALLWAVLHDISQQVIWYGKKLAPEDWKHILTASLRKLEVVPNIDGTGFVALGMSTSRMSVREMSDLIELAYAFGAEHSVIWSEAERVAA